MRLAGHTYTFRAYGLDGALDRLADAGFDRIELWAGHAPDGTAGVARALDRRGLEAAAVGAGGFYTAEDVVTVAAATFALAQAVGAPVVVACVSPPLLPSLARALPRDLQLCVENHWDQPLARPTDVLRALANAGCGASVSACLDTGHALMAGIDPLAFVAALGPSLGHVHLKDARRTPAVERLLGVRARRRLLRPQPVRPGSGALDVPALLSALVAAGFTGSVSLEHEGADQEESLAALIELTRAPTPSAPGYRPGSR